VDELLPLKNKLDLLSKRVQEVKRAITEILNNDEDLAMMYLSPPPSPHPFPSESNSPKDSGSDKLSSDDEEIFNNENENKKEQKKILGRDKNALIDTMSLEMLFENYLNEVEWIASEIDGLLDNITNTEENVVLQLDLLRNRILRFELTLSISSFVVTCGALVTGLFGMNLISHFENNGSMFYIISAIMFSSMLWTFTSFRRYGYREKLF
jgi:magnesium transporter